MLSCFLTRPKSLTTSTETPSLAALRSVGGKLSPTLQAFTSCTPNILTDFDAPIGAVGFFVKDVHCAGGVLKVAHGCRRFTGTPSHPLLHRVETVACAADVLGDTDVEIKHLDAQQLSCTTAGLAVHLHQKHTCLCCKMSQPLSCLSQATPPHN